MFSTDLFQDFFTVRPDSVVLLVSMKTANQKIGDGGAGRVIYTGKGVNWRHCDVAVAIDNVRLYFIPTLEFYVKKKSFSWVQMKRA